MPSIFGTNQSPRVTAQHLNSVNDPSPGLPISASVPGSIIQTYRGQLGALLTLSDEMAALLSNPSVGTLYGGVYQYVQFKSTDTVAPARGLLCAWDDYENFVVTMDITDPRSGKIAGVVLNAVTKGNYGWIQVAGKASVKYAGTITKVSPADGDLLVLASATANDVDILADATALTSPVMKRAVGVALQTPAAGQVRLAWLTFLRLNPGS